MLMLAFMVGNLWLCIVIVGVSTLAYFITSWSRIPLQKAPKNRQRYEVQDLLIKAVKADMNISLNLQNVDMT